MERLVFVRVSVLYSSVPTIQISGFQLKECFASQIPHMLAHSVTADFKIVLVTTRVRSILQRLEVWTLGKILGLKLNYPQISERLNAIQTSTLRTLKFVLIVIHVFVC